MLEIQKNKKARKLLFTKVKKFFVGFFPSSSQGEGRVRLVRRTGKKLWKPAIAVTILASILIYTLFPNGNVNIPSAEASTNTFNQTAWTTASTTASAVDPTNKTGWSYYNSTSKFNVNKHKFIN